MTLETYGEAIVREGKESIENLKKSATKEQQADLQKVIGLINHYHILITHYESEYESDD